MITIRNLTKRYQNLTVLNQVNLDISDGDIYGLVGVSGVGKSTLLGCLNGLEKFQQGSICIDDVKVEQLKGASLRAFRKNMGMVFQNFSLIGRKNVYHNIAFPMQCWGYGKKETDQRVREMARLVGIDDKLEERPANLSGGQKQRVAIARALMLKPKYILCDECTSALDPRTTNSILNLLKSIHKELDITIIVVTHEMSVIRKICQKIAILEEGRIVEHGLVADIFRNQPEALLNLTGARRSKDDERFLEINREDIDRVTAYLKEQKVSYREVRKEEIECLQVQD